MSNDQASSGIGGGMALPATVPLAAFSPRVFRFVGARELQMTEDLTASGMADGVRFFCPRCFTRNLGPQGTHSVLYMFEHPISVGVTLAVPEDIVLVGLSQPGCAWDGVIDRGQVTT